MESENKINNEEIKQEEEKPKEENNKIEEEDDNDYEKLPTDYVKSDYNYKVIVIGDSGVGKTCLTNFAVKGEFMEGVIPTVGYEFYPFVVRYKDKIIKLEIWDTCGQEKYRHLVNIFFKEAKVVILVYDSTSRKSFNDMKNYWYNKVKESAQEDLVFAVAANKLDLFDKQQVSEEEGKKFAEEINAIFEITSAYNGVGIDELFEKIGMKLAGLEENENNNEDKKQNILLIKEDITKNTNNNKICCQYI